VRHEAKFCCRLNTEGGHVAGFGGGPDEKLYVLICMGEKDGGWFKRRSTCDWRVLSIAASGDSHEYRVPNQKDNFNLVQPLPNGFFLATRRCEFSEQNLRLNGKVFDFDGMLVRSILLGDGIEDLQVDESGQIWVSYFDEGIFGNLGWKRPLGSSGLRQFDDRGYSNFEFKPLAGLDAIDDCYALNVTSSNETWCYYYSQFPIVRILERRIVQYWLSPIERASGLCVWRRRHIRQDAEGEYYHLVTALESHERRKGKLCQKRLRPHPPRMR
jgi:hypothetical protein